MSRLQDKFILTVVTPKGVEYTADCDTVLLNICEGKNGTQSGSYGVKKGHANAVFALAGGKITVKKDGRILYSFDALDGFAVMQDNVLTVTVEDIKK